MTAKFLGLAYEAKPFNDEINAAQAAGPINITSGVVSYFYS